MSKSNQAAALFIKEDSIYKKLLHECWDIKKDATRYKGKLPVIVHPPCQLWSALRGLSTAPASEKQLALIAVAQVRKYGGVLEHPARSTLFGTILPLPGKVDEYGGYSICVNMSWFNYPCTKKTLLYIVGCNQKNLPPIPIKFDAIQYVISTRVNHKNKNSIKKEIPKAMRDVTPEEMAKWLIETASRCRVEKYISQPKKFSDNSGQLHKIFANIHEQKKSSTMSSGTIKQTIAATIQ